MRALVAIVMLVVTALAAQPAIAQGGGGTGGGGSECADGFRVFLGAERLWTTNVDTFVDRPDVRILTEGHSEGRPALALADVLADLDDIRSVEVVSCSGRSQTLRAGQLRHGEREYYIVLNKRGAFKLVAQVNGREVPVTRQVGRIIIMPRE